MHFIKLLKPGPKFGKCTGSTDLRVIQSEAFGTRDQLMKIRETIGDSLSILLPFFPIQLTAKSYNNRVSYNGI